ncbi:hypothetical protein NDU88_002247 [Pleurodeles waltl]|uniref:Uncharacterized protein n=1 Tax=Pleurodeles waltl TaxID=8319 RepID=A0AAV7UX19_PLEWA|nr:hypothetical protein NDU88_002247 [Pleurodeles waltl]
MAAHRQQDIPGNPEGEGDGNPDIPIPLTLNNGLPRRPVSRLERNAEVAERRPDPSSIDHRRPESLHKEGTLDEGQGGLEMRGLRHVHGATWLKQEGLVNSSLSHLIIETYEGCPQNPHE